MGHCLTID
uniref:Uncharacterized protein n=1 Tax=Anguilla anguilla TaxID=7936 RepID=A0A0E9TU09_ANGAN